MDFKPPADCTASYPIPAWFPPPPPREDLPVFYVDVTEQLADIAAADAFADWQLNSQFEIYLSGLN